MPPKGKGLSQVQVDTLRRWIGEGGKYDKHWAYVAPKRPDLPVVKATKQIANPIDRFTLRRLEERGLTFSEPADKARWLRRVSLGPARLTAHGGATGRFLWATIRKTPAKRWWTPSKSRPVTASIGPASGSTWPATPTPMVFRPTSCATAGPTATG